MSRKESDYVKAMKAGKAKPALKNVSDADLVALRNAGLSFNEISAAINYELKVSAIYQRLKKLGLAGNQARKVD